VSFETTRPALAPNPHLFGSFVEAAPDAVVIVDADGAIVLVNAQAEAMFGYPREELTGRPVEVLLPERFHESHVSHRRQYAAEPHTRPMGAGLGLFGRRKDGSELPVDVSLSPLPANGETLLAAAIRDVTDRRRLEELRDEFIRNAAHELRTPLATISTLGETLASHIHELSPDQLDEALAALRRQSRRANTLVSNLLDLSQLEGGRADVEISSVSLRATVDRALDSAPPPEEHTLEVEVDERLRVLADASRLEQVVTNLLTNAYRYGGVHIRLQASADDGDVTLRVVDDGRGVPEELVADLFEPFTRGARATEVGGSGIGLALSRRLMETFGGSLGYEPHQPTGARFVCRLRAAP
jgi:PAS domain S-box-containing protein